uniref:Putative secreted protein n=1 Tax=Anopheles marajoara TaxID=58244 RepID=A0A2M4CD78_9DIPT
MLICSCSKMGLGCLPGVVQHVVCFLFANPCLCDYLKLRGPHRIDYSSVVVYVSIPSGGDSGRGQKLPRFPPWR